MIINADTPVEVTFTKLESGEPDNSEILRQDLPGATEQCRGRGFTIGTFSAHCFADGRALPGIEITARFETTCQGPPVESDDPVEVIRAFEDAINARDPHAVCSLFSDDATAELVMVIGAKPRILQGNELMADVLTYRDDNLWFQKTDFLDIETSEGVVTWREEWSTYSGPIQWCNTAEVDNRKIVTFGQAPCPPTE